MKRNKLTSCVRALISDSTYFLRLSNWFIRRNGRKILSVRRPLNWGTPGIKTTQPAIITMKSSQFHPFLR